MKKKEKKATCVKRLNNVHSGSNLMVYKICIEILQIFFSTTTNITLLVLVKKKITLNKFLIKLVLKFILKTYLKILLCKTFIYKCFILFAVLPKIFNI